MDAFITTETGTDEYGEPVWNWFCNGCGEGGSNHDPETTLQEADEHEAMHERMAGEDETA